MCRFCFVSSQTKSRAVYREVLSSNWLTQFYLFMLTEDYAWLGSQDQSLAEHHQCTSQLKSIIWPVFSLEDITVGLRQADTPTRVSLSWNKCSLFPLSLPIMFYTTFINTILNPNSKFFKVNNPCSGHPAPSVLRG